MAIACGLILPVFLVYGETWDKDNQYELRIIDHLNISLSGISMLRTWDVRVNHDLFRDFLL